MKKFYITPLVEYIDVDQDDLLAGSPPRVPTNYEVIDPDKGMDSGDQTTEDTDLGGDSGAKMASWNFSAGEDW